MAGVAAIAWASGLETVNGSTPRLWSVEMQWFSALFLCAFVLAILSGKAYFRGTVDRAEDPARYWSFVACYAALALLVPATRVAALVMASALALPLGLVTDAATRLAHDLEAGAKVAERSDSGTFTVVHVLRAWPEGCGGNYTVQLSQSSSLVVWCQDETWSHADSSYSTTYHLRFVEVPETRKVDKRAGEATYVDLARRAGRVVVVGLR